MSEFILVKADNDKRLVFGFFSVAKVGEKVLLDRQRHQVDTETLEYGVYDFVLEARVAGENHTELGVGRLVESFMITPEKQNALVSTLKARGIDAKMDLGVDAWWGGFYIDSDEMWGKIKKGEYPMFSIGGTGNLVPIEEER